MKFLEELPCPESLLKNSAMLFQMPNSLKRKFYNQCVLPVVIHGAEKWSLTQQLAQKFAKTKKPTKEVCYV